MQLDYKKWQQDRKELILIRRSFASFVVVKRQEEGRKNPFVAHFKPKKKESLAILNGWTLQRDQVCVKKCVTRNEKWNPYSHSFFRASFSTLHMLNFVSGSLLKPWNHLEFLVGMQGLLQRSPFHNT